MGSLSLSCGTFARSYSASLFVVPGSSCHPWLSSLEVSAPSLRSSPQVPLCPNTGWPRFGSVTVCAWDGSSGSGFRFRRFFSGICFSPPRLSFPCFLEKGQENPSKKRGFFIPAEPSKSLEKKKGKRPPQKKEFLAREKTRNSQRKKERKDRVSILF